MHVSKQAEGLRQKILDYILANPDADQSVIAAELGKSRITVNRHVKRLKEDGVIVVLKRAFAPARYVPADQMLQTGHKSTNKPVRGKEELRERKSLLSVTRGLAWVAPALSMVVGRAHARHEGDCCCEFGIQKGDQIAPWEDMWFHPQCLYELARDVIRMPEFVF